jgi:hypothetical protein
VIHDASSSRFECPLGDEPPATLTYRLVGHRATFDHTFVPESARGRGIAAALVRAGLEEARRRGWQVVPQCSYVSTFLERHPEFADIVRPRPASA